MLQSVKKKKIKSKSVAKSRKPLHEFPVKPYIYMGLDVGTASCGWSIVHVDDAEKYPLDEEALKIEAGVWMFKEPVTDKERSPKNVTRRAKRLERRTIRRRKIRKEKIRQILFKAGLIDTLKPQGTIQDDAIGKHNAKPWRLRQKALGLNLTKDENGILETNELKKHELASVILHIAKRRGFKSNAKNDGANAETSKMKLAMTQFQGKIHTSYATAVHENATTIKIGNHEQKRYRNVSGDYQFTPYRDDILAELHKIFEAQAKHHPTIITDNFKQEIETIITHVNPMQDPEKMVGKCTFYEHEKRCSMSSPSYELFRFLSKLATLKLKKIDSNEKEQFFTPEQIALCEKLFWKQKKITFNDIQKTLSGFEFYPKINADQIKHDITSPKGEAGKATHILKEHLKDLGLFDDDYTKTNLKTLDRIAYIISFYNNTDKIKTELQKIKCLLPDDVQNIMTVMEDKDFNSFNKAGHLSSKALRQLIPHLRNGLKYNKACEKIGFDFRDRPKLDPIRDIANPSAKKSVHEAFKQVRALIHKMGYRPEKIFIEMTRDIAQTKKVKKEIEDSIKVNEKFNIDLTKKFQDNHNIALDFNNKEEFLAYKLWERQGGICVYSGNSIPVDFIKGNETQIDHILPFSRFLDDAQNNKVLVFTAENQRKGNQTPYEWFKRDGKDWQAFKDRIHNMNLHKRVKWALCLEPVEKDGKMIYPQESQMSRGALNATGYAVKYLKDYLQQEIYGDEPKPHKEGGTVRIFPRAGKITSLLRKSWGIEDLKYVPNTKPKKRLDDQRHHALDAIVIATADNKTLDRLVYYAAQMREKGKFIKNAVPELEKPCTNFRRKIEDLYNNHIVVSRGEDKRARGKLHDDTLCSIRNTGKQDKNGKDILKTIKRKEVSKLKISDLDKLHEEAKKNYDLIDALTDYINMPETEGFMFNGKKKATVDLLIDGKKEKKSVFDLEEHEIDLIDNIDENFELKQALLEYVVIPKKPALVFKGVPIKKISLYDQPASDDDFTIRGAKPNALEMCRADLFVKTNDKGKKSWHLVPIYKHHLLDKSDSSKFPNKDTDNNEMDSSFEFKFSLYPFSYIRITRGEKNIEGFYRKLNVSNHNITVTMRNNSCTKRKAKNPNSGIIFESSIKGVDNIQKFTMNRFGVLTEIKSEKRSWGLPKQ